MACHVSKNDSAYLAIDNNKIIVYNLVTKEVQSIFDSYQSQTVIYIMSIETEKGDYLTVITRTSCVLYSLHENGVRRMTSYLLNSRKKPYRTLEENRFSYQVRFYFTSAKVVKAVDEEANSDQGKKEPQGVGLLGLDYNLNDAASVSEAADFL